MRNKIKRILAAVMAAGMTLSVIPSIPAFAAQSNEYVDPADVWIEANGRTSEFDINATVTTGTMFCPVCDMPTSNISYRVPEYTRTGETAYNQQKLQERMKSINAYYRKNKTLDGCPDLSAADIEQLKADMSRGFRIEEKPFPTWALSNNNAEIRRLKQRIEDIKRRDATDYKGWNFDGGTVKPNKDINRLQIFFDDKPDADIRAELKSNGFRWAPSEGAWQRQLTDNALYAAKHLKVIEPIADNELQEENTDISQTLNELTADEKQAIVDGVEFALDCNLADTVPQSDMDLYNAIIKERSEQKPSIKEALQTAKEQAAKQPAAQPSQKKEDISL